MGHNFHYHTFLKCNIRRDRLYIGHHSKILKNSRKVDFNGCAKEPHIRSITKITEKSGKHIRENTFQPNFFDFIFRKIDKFPIQGVPLQVPTTVGSKTLLARHFRLRGRDHMQYFGIGGGERRVGASGGVAPDGAPPVVAPLHRRLLSLLTRRPHCTGRRGPSQGSRRLF